MESYKLFIIWNICVFVSPNVFGNEYSDCTKALIDQAESPAWTIMLNDLSPEIPSSENNGTKELDKQIHSRFLVSTFLNVHTIKVTLKEQYRYVPSFSLKPVIFKWLRSAGLEPSDKEADVELKIDASAFPTSTKYYIETSSIWPAGNYDLYTSGAGKIRVELYIKGQDSVSFANDITIPVPKKLVGGSVEDKYKEPKDSPIWGRMNFEMSTGLSEIFAKTGIAAEPLLLKKLQQTPDDLATANVLVGLGSSEGAKLVLNSVREIIDSKDLKSKKKKKELAKFVKVFRSVENKEHVLGLLELLKEAPELFSTEKEELFKTLTIVSREDASKNLYNLVDYFYKKSGKDFQWFYLHVIPELAEIKDGASLKTLIKLARSNRTSYKDSYWGKKVGNALSKFGPAAVPALISVSHKYSDVSKNSLLEIGTSSLPFLAKIYIQEREMYEGMTMWERLTDTRIDDRLETSALVLTHLLDSSINSPEEYYEDWIESNIEKVRTIAAKTKANPVPQNCF